MTNGEPDSANIINGEIIPLEPVTSSSEDIVIIESKIDEYLRFQAEIRGVIRSDDTEKDAILKDIVEAIAKLDDVPTPLKIVTLGVIPLRNHLKRKKMRKVVEIILEKIFDVTLGWYVMDYEDVKEICDYVAGRNQLTSTDHRYLYVGVVQKLQVGPIRDKCVRLGIVNFLNDKLIDIRNNFLEFKRREL